MTESTPITLGPQPGPARTRRRWPYAAGALAALAAAYVGLAVTSGGEVPGGTTVGGVPLEGLTRDEARAKLADTIAPRVTAPVSVRLGEATVRLDPARAGLAVDSAASVDGLTGITFNPRALITRLRGGGPHPLVTRIDRDALSSALTAASGPATIEAKDATLAFDKAKVIVTPGVDAVTVKVPATLDAIVAAWPATGPIKGVVATAEPTITDAEVATAKADFADKIVAGPITVKVDAKSFSVEPASLVSAITLEPKEGALALTFDDAGLLKAIRAAGTKAGVLVKGTDATVTAAQGSYQVIASRDGVDVDDTETVAAVKAALLSEDRIAVAKATVDPADFTTKEAQDSIPTGVISTFTTNFPVNPDRTHNITLAVNSLNGTYVAPGEQFSLNALLGQRTAAKGYRAAPVIMNGRLTIDYGGGISQVSTTLFNAVFFSGIQIDEYHPHSFYISRYPEGREATISWPDVDQKFTNTTKGGILIEAKVGPNSITVTFFGRKQFDVESVQGSRVNVVQPRTIRDDRAGCVPQSPATGFDVTVTRVISENGKEVKRSPFTTHYIPEDLVICTNGG